MSFDYLTSAEAQRVLIAVLAMAVLAALLLRRQSQIHSRREQDLQEQLHQSTTELTLCAQKLEQVVSNEAKDREQLSSLQDQLKQYQVSLSEKDAQLAVLENKAADLDAIKASAEVKERELRQLHAEHQSLQAKSLAEKNSLEEKLALLKDAREQLNNEFSLLANKIFDDKQQRFTEQSQQTLSASVNPLKEQIEAFRKKVEDAYDKENSERSKLVGQIAELQKQTRQIGEDAINLTNALKGDNKAQGNWGEVILERLLEDSGLQRGREYEVQVALKNEEGKRRNPDVIIRLPEGKDIIIDSKVSLLHYEQYTSATEEVSRQQALKQHLTSVRNHVQQLSGKSYDKLEGIRSLDFVFLFIPVEAAFMSALQADQSLFQDAYSKHIILVSPTTLLASLRTVENIWRYEKQNQNAEEIARQAGGLYDQFALLIEAFEDVGKQIDKASQAYTLTHKRLATGRGNLMRRVESLKLLGAKTKKQLTLDKSDEPVTSDEADNLTTDKIDAE
ncbi:DNA recombination protein RmuC [Pseudomaricurvus sp.]|uniref:DNA recombination protein RmuC n=1 Tax=Pseudomaricurvus sp. TaxID=2004510 RepID=UPI003F6BD206